ncbi:MAG: hypothetical protein KA436_03540 [Oligoflexales bacterium]|nr:hypothetical protein [Oligoflexales bacterium]
MHKLLKIFGLLMILLCAFSAEGSPEQRAIEAVVAMGEAESDVQDALAELRGATEAFQEARVYLLVGPYRARDMELARRAEARNQAAEAAYDHALQVQTIARHAAVMALQYLMESRRIDTDNI